MSKEIPCPKCGHVWLWADWKKDKDAFCPKGHGCASEDKITMSDDLVKRLRERAKIASEEGNMTAKCDANYFEKSADRIEELESDLAYWQKDSADAWDKCEDNRVKLAKAVDALGEAIYLLDPDEEDIAKETGLHRIVTTYAELTSSEAANGEAKGGKDE